GDAVFILDPYLDALLLCGFFAGGLKPNAKRIITILSLIAAVAYIGLRIEFHSMAAAELRKMFPEAGKLQIERSIVIPQALNLRVWDGIVETKDEVTRVPIYVLLQSTGVDVEPLMMKRSPPSNIQTDAA